MSNADTNAPNVDTSDTTTTFYRVRAYDVESGELIEQYTGDMRHSAMTRLLKYVGRPGVRVEAAQIKDTAELFFDNEPEEMTCSKDATKDVDHGPRPLFRYTYSPATSASMSWRYIVASSLQEATEVTGNALKVQWVGDALIL